MGKSVAFIAEGVGVLPELVIMVLLLSAIFEFELSTVVLFGMENDALL